MKSNLITFIATVLLMMPAALVSAQASQTAKDLVDQGVALNDAGKYTEAVEKYTEALKANPNDLHADYEMAYTLYSEGKGLDAIPFLEKITQSNDSKYESYELLGSIYDDNNQSDKAIDCYKKGIADNPKFERLYFNLGITYSREHKYAEAEDVDTIAIKLDPKHASVQREYGLVAYHLGKKAISVMAFCSFLLLEPNTDRSVTVYAYLNNIFKNENAQNTISIALDKDTQGISALSSANMSVNFAAGARAALGKKNADSVVNLEFALKMIFEATGKAYTKPAVKTDFDKAFYIDFFYKLAESGNMPAFTRLISLTAYKDENLAWFNENKKQLDDLDMWIRSTPRDF